MKKSKITPNTKFTIYLTKHRLNQKPSIILLSLSPSENVRKAWGTEYSLEILGFGKDEETARRVAQQQYPKLEIQIWLKGYNTGKFSAEALERIAAAKRGKNNPNAKGRSPEANSKTSNTMKGTRKGTDNPMYGKKHSATTKLKMALNARTRTNEVFWALDPYGREYLLVVGTPLPDGWILGRKRYR
jgi:hypothetical protein